MWTFIVVDDDARLADSIAALAREWVPDLAQVHALSAPRDALALLDLMPAQQGRRLIVLSDYNLRDPTFTGLDVLGHAQARHPESTRLLMSGEPPEDTGAHDEPARVHRFFEKPFHFGDLFRALPSSRGADAA